MMGDAIYYPTIDIYNSDWLKSALLYYDSIRTIAPSSVREPYSNQDTKILSKEGYLQPLRCELHSGLLDKLGERVVKLIDGSNSEDNLNIYSQVGIDPVHLKRIETDFCEKISAILSSSREIICRAKVFDYASWTRAHETREILS